MKKKINYHTHRGDDDHLCQALENMSKWCDSAEHHLSKEQTRSTDEQDLLSQIRQVSTTSKVSTLPSITFSLLANV